jgi:hypothetical protein
MSSTLSFSSKLFNICIQFSTCFTTIGLLRQGELRTHPKCVQQKHPRPETRTHPKRVQQKHAARQLKSCPSSHFGKAPQTPADWWIAIESEASRGLGRATLCGKSSCPIGVIFSVFWERKSPTSSTFLRQSFMCGLTGRSRDVPEMRNTQNVLSGCCFRHNMHNISTSPHLEPNHCRNKVAGPQRSPSMEQSPCTPDPNGTSHAG